MEKDVKNIYIIKLSKRSNNVINELKERWEHTLNDEISVDDMQKAYIITQKVPKCVYNRYVQ